MKIKVSYKPRKKSAELLNWTLAKINEVPYKVSRRWAFYRCVQAGRLTKKDIGRFSKLTARARKNFWNGWNPTTFVDDTREILRYGEGFENFKKWIEKFEDEKPLYEKFSAQKNLVMIWFEAEAMRSQFMHYARPYNVPLAPFKGDPSIEYKWRISRYLAQLYCKFGRKPIKILYFGDYEPIKNTGSRGKGLRIPLDALKDIRVWLRANYVLEEAETDEEIAEVQKRGDYPKIKYIRCGLNPEHVEKWDLPQNPTRPSEYQWEALDDDKARELIEGSIEKHWDVRKVEEIEEKEEKDQERWEDILRDVQKRIEVSRGRTLGLSSSREGAPDSKLTKGR